MLRLYNNPLLSLSRYVWAMGVPRCAEWFSVRHTVIKGKCCSFRALLWGCRWMGLCCPNSAALRAAVTGEAASSEQSPRHIVCRDNLPSPRLPGPPQCPPPSPHPVDTFNHWERNLGPGDGTVIVLHVFVLFLCPVLKVLKWGWELTFLCSHSLQAQTIIANFLPPRTGALSGIALCKWLCKCQPEE